MSELATMARPYALAAFKRAKETQSTELWAQNLVFLSAVLSNKELVIIIDNPKLSKQRLLELMLDICEQQISHEALNFLKLLIANDRLALVPDISLVFETYKAEDEGYLDVEVATAYAFSEDGEKKFAATLEKTFSKKVRMKVTVDKSLIGGVLVRAGDRVIDGSIKGRLQTMKKALI